jgi:hypothetical protein
MLNFFENILIWSKSKMRLEYTKIFLQTPAPLRDIFFRESSDISSIPLNFRNKNIGFCEIVNPNKQKTAVSNFFLPKFTANP